MSPTPFLAHDLDILKSILSKICEKMNGAANLASVMQQSLNPRKPERSSGAHYPNKAAVVEAYKRMVSYVILVNDDNV